MADAVVAAEEANGVLEEVVNPWEVSGEIDYGKLMDKVGFQRLDASLVDRVRCLTFLPPHVFLRRGVFFAHWDFNEILDAYEKGNPPLDPLHVHQVPPGCFQGSSRHSPNHSKDSEVNVGKRS